MKSPWPALAILALATGCGGGVVSSVKEEPPGASPTTTRAPDLGVPDVAARDADFTFNPVDGGGEAGATPGGCSSGPDEDRDQDGYTVAQGDCNDCDNRVNPGAYDVAGNHVDEDCSGTADDEPAGCDTGLPLDADAA